MGHDDGDVAALTIEPGQSDTRRKDRYRSGPEDVSIEVGRREQCRADKGGGPEAEDPHERPEHQPSKQEFFTQRGEHDQRKERESQLPRSGAARLDLLEAPLHGRVEGGTGHHDPGRARDQGEPHADPGSSDSGPRPLDADVSRRSWPGSRRQSPKPNARSNRLVALERTAATDASELFVIGGAELYAQTLARADRLYLTWVHAQVPGDTFFPTFDLADWIEIERERHEPDRDHAYGFSFVTYDRRARAT